MTTLTRLIAIVLVSQVSFAGGVNAADDTAEANKSNERQYYTKFEAYPKRGYSLSHYFYKPYEGYSGHKYLYLIRPGLR